MSAIEKAALGLALATASAPPNAVTGAAYGSQTALPRWRAARARALAGTGAANIGCLGDSKTLGYGSSSAGLTNAKVFSYPRQLAAFLTNLGLKAADRSFFGDGHPSAPWLTNCQAADPRLSFGSAWAQFGSQSLGGFFFQNSTTSDPFAFSPGAAAGLVFDTVDIWTASTSGNASYSVNVDGGAVLTGSPVAPSTPWTLRKNTFSCARGNHTINFYNPGSAAALYLLGMATRDATPSASTVNCSVHNYGSFAVQASQLTPIAGVWSPLSMIGSAANQVACDLYLVNLGTNEWINGVSPATFITNMQTIIAALLLVGDVILIAPSFGNAANYSQASMNAIISACYALAAQFNVPLIDHTLRMGTWASANALGMFYDKDHENAVGYADEAFRIAQILMAA